jgi:hypothetical protein
MDLKTNKQLPATEYETIGEARGGTSQRRLHGNGTKMRSSKRACLLITSQVTLRLSEQRTSRTYDVVDQLLLLLLLLLPACNCAKERDSANGVKESPKIARKVMPH